MDRSLVDLARSMIAIDSVTTQGTRALASFCAAGVLAGGDLQVALDEGDGPAEVNLLATKGLDAAPPILLNSHLDTVPAGDPALWTSCAGDPFSARLEGDRLYGLGTADAKLDWLCKALALRRFDGRPFSRGLIFVGTFGEESGLRGARAILPRLPAKPVAAWVGEPTELELVTRHKGLLVVKVVVRDPRGAGDVAARLVRWKLRGRSAHSSTPHLGENAILRALRLIAAKRLRIATVRGGDAANKVPAACLLEVASDGLPDPGPGVVGEPLGGSPARLLSHEIVAFLQDLAVETERLVSSSTIADAEFAPPTLTTNFGRVDAAEDRAEAELDFRCLPGDPPERLIESLEKFLARERRDRRLEISLEIERSNPPLETAADSPAIAWSLAILAELRRSTVLRTKAGCTEAGVYAAAGIPSVVFGPGRSAGNIHAPNEHVSVAALEGAIDFYARLIERACLP